MRISPLRNGSLAVVVAHALGASLAAQGTLWIAGSETDPVQKQQSLAAAVAAAQPGDSILVRPGTYDGFTLAAKPLAIVADGGTVALTAHQGVLVRDLGAAQSVVLRGLKGRLRIESCAGFAWIEDHVATSDTQLNAALACVDCAAVALARCTSTGIAGGFQQFPGVGGPGLFMTASNVVANDSTFTGGLGSYGGLVYGYFIPQGGFTGGAGVYMSGGSLHLQGSHAEGGSGGGGGTTGQMCAVGGSGGAGIQQASGQLTTLDDTLAGGAPGMGGFAPWGNCPSGSRGPSFDFVSGAQHAYAGDARTLVLTPVTREGESLNATLHGASGDWFVLGVAAAPNALALPLCSGVLWLAGVPAIAANGVADASGNATWSFAIGELGAGTDFALVHAQALAVSTGGACYLTGGSAALVVDAAF